MLLFLLASAAGISRPQKEKEGVEGIYIYIFFLNFEK